MFFDQFDEIVTLSWYVSVALVRFWYVELPSLAFNFSVSNYVL